VEDSGHMTTLEHPERIVELLRDWATAH